MEMDTAQREHGDDTTDANKLDGNAAAGDLGMLFPVDVTTIRVTCGGCGTEGMIGEAAAYISAIGTVIRCPSCDTVLIRVMQARGAYRYDMAGVRRFVVPE